MTADQPPAGPELRGWQERVEATRAQVRHRHAARRSRRQALPALIAGSMTLAGTGVAVAWVTAQMPKPAPSVQAPAPTTVPDATLAALTQRLTTEEQALQTLAGQLSAAGTQLAAPPPVVATPVRVAPRVVAAPATHATTGASHAH